MLGNAAEVVVAVAVVKQTLPFDIVAEASYFLFEQHFEEEFAEESLVLVVE